jgi:uncharacterized membrane protein
MKPVLAPLFTVVGLLFVGLAIPLIKRRIKPNGLYGLRIPATFADEWVWYEANARTGRDMLSIGLIQIAAALLFLPLPDLAYAATNGLLTLGGAITMCIAGIRRANRLLEERRSSESRPVSAS